MGSRIDNLGDYNKVRLDLQDAHGSKEKLYKLIGDTAVSKETPKLLLKGGALFATLSGIAYLGYKGFCFMKERKQKLENEYALKNEFIETIESDGSQTDEKIDDDSVF